MNRATILLSLFFIALPSLGFSYENVAAPAVESSSDVSSHRSKTEEWMISPGRTGTVSTQFNFITSDEDLQGLLGTDSLKFTDVVLWRLATRYSIAGVAEIFGNAALIPKQPSMTDELVFQNAGGGVRIGLIEWLATSLRFQGGSTLNNSGSWYAAALGLDARTSIDDYVIFDLGLFGQGTGISIGDETPGFVEVGGSFQIVFQAPGIAAAWFGTELAIPVGDKAGATINLNPQNRFNVVVGGVLSFIENWDIYATYHFLDRGDVESPSTLLPILDGGFDQQQLAVGLTYHFGSPAEDEDKDDLR